MPGVQADLIVRDRATGTIRKVTSEVKRMEQTTVEGSKRMNAELASGGNEIARLVRDAVVPELRRLQLGRGGF